jgi:hypothetical protein
MYKIIQCAFCNKYYRAIKMRKVLVSDAGNEKIILKQPICGTCYDKVIEKDEGIERVEILGEGWGSK